MLIEDIQFVIEMFLDKYPDEPLENIKIKFFNYFINGYIDFLRLHAIKEYRMRYDMIAPYYRCMCCDTSVWDGNLANHMCSEVHVRKVGALWRKSVKYWKENKNN